MTEIRVSRTPDTFGFGIDLRVIDLQRMAYAEPIKMIEAAKGAFVPVTMGLELSEGQKLMDSLWECGIRPMAAAGSAGQIEAVERHLKDMRTLAFSALKVREPE